MLFDIMQHLGILIKVTKKYNSREQISFCIQITDVKFYKFLQSINLSPHKSLTIPKLKIPQKYFNDFVRGVIDGDGSITRWINNSNKNEQWSLRIVSASKAFIEWLLHDIFAYLHAVGKIYTYKHDAVRKNNLYLLKFGKVGAKIILKECYYEGCLSLKRKSLRSAKCLTTKSGWTKYKSMICPGAVIGSQN